MDSEALCGGVDTLPDDELVSRVRAGDTALYGLLVRRYHRRLHRIASSILRDDAEAEDAVQDAYMQAFSHLHQFAGRSSFSTWLTRIAICEAVGRRRRRRRPETALGAESDRLGLRMPCPAPDPERQALDRELCAAIDALAGMLPEEYRSVFVLREIEEMSTVEAARRLRLSPECVKTRLHRARLLLRHKISRRIEGGNAKYQRLSIALLANRSSCQRVSALIQLKRKPACAFRAIAAGRGKVVPMPAAGRRALYLRNHTVSPEAAAS